MEILDIFWGILHLCEQKGYSDIHLSTGYFPIIRNTSWEIQQVQEFYVGEDLVTLNIFQTQDIDAILMHILSKENYLAFMMQHEIDISYSNNGRTRYRVNCYQDTQGNSIAFRLIPEEIPTLESLGFWDTIKNLCQKSKGLILMTGPTGSGKSTNLAGMIDYINTNFKKHIITIEDPIEFVFKNKLSLINQREVGVHTKSFERAMKSCLREDPNVIMVWEMRDPETIKAAITLAETWHLVFSTLHTNDTVQSIDRMVDVFPAEQQDQIRMQLAMSLVAVIAQRLLPRADKDEKIAAREILLNNDAVRNLIISWKSHQLYSVIEIGQRQGMILMDAYLGALYKKGFITKDVLMSSLRDTENVDYLIS